MNFISRLSKDQVINFLKKQFPENKEVYIHFDTYLEPLIYVIISYSSDLGDDMCYDFILTQFEVRAFPRIRELTNKIWHDFMVEQFGDEYEQAYIESHVVS